MIISITYANLRGETGLDAIRSNYFTLAKRLLLVAGAVTVSTRMKGYGGISGKHGHKEERPDDKRVWGGFEYRRATYTPPLT